MLKESDRTVVWKERYVTATLILWYIYNRKNIYFE